MESINELWDSACAYIKNSGAISQAAFDVWIKNIQPQRIEDGEMVVYVNTDFMKNTILNTYGDKLQDALQQVLGVPLGLRVISREGSATAAPEPGYRAH